MESAGFDHVLKKTLCRVVRRDSTWKNCTGLPGVIDHVCEEFREYRVYIDVASATKWIPVCRANQCRFTIGLPQSLTPGGPQRRIVILEALDNPLPRSSVGRLHDVRPTVRE